MRLFGFVANVFFTCAGWIVRVFQKLNENSFNKKILNKKFDGFFAKTILGCAPVRIVRWFFDLPVIPRLTRNLIDTPCNGERPRVKPGVTNCETSQPHIFELRQIFNMKIFYMLFLLCALMVPGHLWNNMYLLLSAIFFAGIFALKWLLENDAKTKLSFEHISPALVLFVFFCALSIFTGYGGSDSVRVFIIFFACVVHSILVSIVVRDKNDMRIFFMLMSVALVFLALFGFYQLLGGIEIREELTDLGVNPGLSRLYATLGNPNNDAQAWAMLLPFVLAVAITVKNDTKRLLLIGAIAIVVAAFALTYSRAGYVALMAGVGVFVLMSAPRLVPIALIALVFALPFIPAAILERLFTLGQDTSSQYRFLIWEGVRRVLEDFWVQGVGMGPAAFVRIYRGYAHPLAERALHSHNTFFDIITHSGIGALLAFFAYLFRLFKRGISAHAASTDHEQKIYIAAGIAAITVFVVFGVGEYVWFHPRVMLVFWIVAGIVSVRMREKKITE
jgi:hypothetical protein